MLPVEIEAPPLDVVYQSIVYPVPTLAEMDVFTSPKHTALVTGPVGTGTVGQLQSGAVTGTSVVQPFKVDVSVTFVPEGIPLTDLAVLSTVPAGELTVPLLVNTIV